ncbi:hypothetical protein [Pedobacter rhizosphaerae]|uniref:Uncharacterized protein n=1 Tax=Pedobacter rhizosphaerae TaxID=390241 RepID=A0A1H9WBJ0_9SPHI|nr:hypothetical protein [Pedobacter rhizosphaerae]SES31159.1 hypothetical protein SAMN04488023_1682 [Pedobacter rhizosphaerae]
MYTSPSCKARQKKKNGNYSESFTELEKLAAAGQADELVKEELKKSYASLNPGKDVSVYMAGFDAQLDKKAEEEAKKIMISEKAPNFMVTDASGKQVSLADFKGKTWIFRPILHHPFRGIVHQSFRAKVHQFLFELIKYSEAKCTIFGSFQDYFSLPFRHIVHHYI